jgi:hypothetical protein
MASTRVNPFYEAAAPPPLPLLSSQTPLANDSIAVSLVAQEEFRTALAERPDLGHARREATPMRNLSSQRPKNSSRRHDSGPTVRFVRPSTPSAVLDNESENQCSSEDDELGGECDAPEHTPQKVEPVSQRHTDSYDLQTMMQWPKSQFMKFLVCPRYWPLDIHY